MPTHLQDEVEQRVVKGVTAWSVEGLVDVHIMSQGFESQGPQHRTSSLVGRLEWPWQHQVSECFGTSSISPLFLLQCYGACAAWGCTPGLVCLSLRGSWAWEVHCPLYGEGLQQVWPGRQTLNSRGLQQLSRWCQWP